MPLVDSFNLLLGRIRETSERERQFTSNAAHELRTPLAALTSIIEQALRRKRTLEETNISLEKSLVMTHDMNQLVERLLALARLDGSDFQTELSDVPIRILVDGAIESFEEMLESRNLQVQCAIPENLTAATDPALLQVVINNLMENAANYADEGSLIVISASNGGGDVKISVINQSREITPESIKRAFEPFWRADEIRSRPGVHAGLGLSICKKIVAIIGGKITADSAQAGEFSVLLNLPATL